MLASQQVLQQLVAQLAAGPTAAGPRVYGDRFHPVDSFPAIKVLLRDEDLSADEEGDSVVWPRVQLHRLRLDVQLLLEATTGLGDAMAAFEASALRALQGTVARATLQPLAGCDLRVLAVRRQPTAEGAAAQLLSTLACEVLFRTRGNDPETLI